MPNQFILSLNKIPLRVRFLLIVSALLFVVSLFFPCYSVMTHKGEEPMASLIALFTGWGEIANLDFAWFANAFFVAAFMMMLQRANKLSFVFSICAVALSAGFFFQRTTIINEAGDTGPIVSLEMGYWLWLLSLTVFSLGSALLFLFSKPSPD